MAIPDISGLSHAEIEELLDAVEARKLVLDAKATTNAEAIRRGISGDVDALVALIGPPASTATAGTNSINALLRRPGGLRQAHAPDAPEGYEGARRGCAGRVGPVGVHGDGGRLIR